MFGTTRSRTRIGSALSTAALIYHSIVRDIRKSHRHAVIGLFMNIAQTLIMVVAFYAMFSILGMRAAALRGDFMLYLLSGIFLFIVHTKTMTSVVGSEGPASAMMQHAPLNTMISICAAAISQLYIQLLSLAIILFGYHTLFTPITIDDPVGAMGMLMLAWFAGIAIGLVLLALRPWYPGFVTIASSIYSRLNMIASGKMFLANTLPGYMLVMFDWNPLFHAIDQARGFIFINYNPHFSSISYAFWVGVVLMLIGMMGEFYTRKNASVSWNATR